MEELFEAISFYTVLNGRNRPSEKKGARMNRVCKAALTGAALYTTMKLGELVGYWKGTFRTAMLYGRNKAWGHQMVDEYAKMYEEKKEA